MNNKKLGLLTAILEHMTLEEVVVYAQEKGLTSLELACWPKQKENRRYAGTSHLDVDQLTDEKVAYVKELLANHDLAISSLGYYPNPLDPNREVGRQAIEHIYKLIDASARLGVYMITTFIGRNKHMSQSDNWQMFETVWSPIVAYAEQKQVRIAIENCPMWFTYDEYPGGLNLASSPAMFQEMFHRIPSRYFGLNFDPSHFVWQQMDYIQVLDAFGDRIFHVHIKDVEVDKAKLDYYGILVPPLKYMAPKLPGLGDINWKKFIDKLHDIQYQGSFTIEFEDKAYESSFQKIDEGIQLAIAYLSQ